MGPDGSSQFMCVGVFHPSFGTGLVFAEHTSHIVERAILKLSLPKSCVLLSLPQEIGPGSKLIFATVDESCVLERIERLDGPGRLLCGLGIDVNRDKPLDLELLPGIGSQRAERIYESRKREGPFLTPCELTRVHGIGEKTVFGIRPWLDMSHLVKCAADFH